MDSAKYRKSHHVYLPEINWEKNGVTQLFTQEGGWIINTQDKQPLAKYKLKHPLPNLQSTWCACLKWWRQYLTAINTHRRWRWQHRGSEPVIWLNTWRFPKAVLWLNSHVFQSVWDKKRCPCHCQTTTCRGRQLQIDTCGATGWERRNKREAVRERSRTSSRSAESKIKEEWREEEGGVWRPILQWKLHGACRGASAPSINPSTHPCPPLCPNHTKISVPLSPILNNSLHSHSLPPEGLVSWRHQRDDLTAPERSEFFYPPATLHPPIHTQAPPHTHTQNNPCQQCDPCVMFGGAPSGLMHSRVYL